MSRSRTTTDHDEIRRWAEERGGKPSAVKRTRRGAKDVGMIRLDFPGYSGEGSLEPITWDQWFDKFDAKKLALVLQDKTPSGEKSNFNKLVARTTAAARAKKSHQRAGARKGRTGAHKPRASAHTTRSAGRAGRATRRAAAKTAGRTGRTRTTSRTSRTRASSRRTSRAKSA